MKSGFTLIELLVAVTLFLLAISIALSATIGSNNLLIRAEHRSALLEGARSTSDTLRRAVATAKLGDIEIDSANNLLTIKRFASDQSQNICVQVGRAHYSYNNQTGQETYDFSPAQSTTKETLVSKNFSMNNQGVCQFGSPVLYQGRLVAASVEATDFQVMMADTDSCSGKCGLLRYSLDLREAGIKQAAATEANKPDLTIASSLAVGVSQ